MDEKPAAEITDHMTGCPAAQDANARCLCVIDGVFCRCVICRRAFTREEVPAELTQCAECGTELKPLFPMHNTTVKINWTELQTLACWAEQFAAWHAADIPDLQRAIYAITQELELQHPMRGALTLGRELGQLKINNPTISAVGNIEPIPTKTRLQ